jgi:diguanylate cyclase (GGDEF)-like protein/PAS domain S-box-containing protein
MTNSALRILLVEDNAADARFVRELLKDAATLIGSGNSAQRAMHLHVVRLQEAVDCLQASAFDVVLLDLSLPDAGGLQAVTRLHAVSPATPIIVMSALHDESHALAGVQAGAQDYLVKSRVDGDTLARAMRYAIARKSDDQRARILIEKSPIGTCIVDEHGVLEIVNPAYAAVFGHTQEELIGRHCSFILGDAQGADFMANLREALLNGRELIADYEILTARGQKRIVHSTAITVTGGDGRPRRAAYVVDVTEQKRYEDRLSFAAQHDALTGLPNRALFRDRLEQAHRDAQRRQGALAVLQVDLNHFKEINDTFGHAAGDTVLTTVADRMQETVRSSDTVARLGGDEFALLLPGSNEAGALSVAGKLRAAICLPIPLPDRTITVNAGIGIALYPEHGDDVADIVHFADLAMYVAKASGGGPVIHNGRK